MRSWLRGDLPTWVIGAVITMIAWEGNQAYKALNAAVEKLNNHEVRITVLEAHRDRRASVPTNYGSFHGRPN